MRYVEDAPCMCQSNPQKHAKKDRYIYVGVCVCAYNHTTQFSMYDLKTEAAEQTLHTNAKITWSDHLLPADVK